MKINIEEVLTSIFVRVSELPTKAEVRVEVLEGVQKAMERHEDRMHKRRRVPRLPLWGKIVTALLSTSAAGAVAAALLR